MNGEYLNFICNALVGHNCDAYYAKHENAILNEAKKIHSQYKFSNNTIYRGVLLDPQEHKNMLSPLDHIKYLSFSTDLSIALDFASTSSEISSIYIDKYPNHRGFIISSEIVAENILFDWRWTKLLNLNLYINGFIDQIMHQKEIIVAQRGKEFSISPV